MSLYHLYSRRALSFLSIKDMRSVNVCFPTWTPSAVSTSCVGVNRRYVSHWQTSEYAGDAVGPEELMPFVSYKNYT